MKSHAGPLRAARNEVMPHIPELAPDLLKQPTVILDALSDSLSNQGVDPQDIPPEDLNKAERYTLAGFAINELRAFTVVQAGRDSELKDFKLRTLPLADKADNFKYSMYRHQRAGSRKVADYYSYGPNEQYRWWDLAKRRYTNLGWAALRMARKHPAIPLEGLGLRFAMHTVALSTTTMGLAEFVRQDLDAPVEERLRATHDLSHIATSMAGIHSLQLNKLGHIPAAKLAEDDNGVYRATFWPKERNWIRQRSAKIGDLPNTILKCPAHAHSVEDLSLTAAAGAPQEKTDTNLQTFVHATINALAQAEMFEDWQPGKLKRFKQWLADNYPT